MQADVDVALEIQLPRERRAVRVLRRVVSVLCSNLGVRGEDVHTLVLALAEACNNVIEHAGQDDTFLVRFTLEDLRASVVVANQHTPASEEAFTTTMPVDPMRESGRGVAIMRALVDEAHFSPGSNGGTLVELRRTVEPQDGSLLAAAVQQT